MIEFKLSQQEIKQLTKEVANFKVILGALNDHLEIDFLIEETENIKNNSNNDSHILA